MDDLLSPYLCGYRKGYSTQQTLVSLIEKWKVSLDNKGFAGAILMDLSKAFDCISHDLLIAKLSSYGFDMSALYYIHSYLNNRKQCVKIDNTYSTFKSLISGVPQGSILGPVYFNISIKKIISFLGVMCCIIIFLNHIVIQKDIINLNIGLNIYNLFNSFLIVFLFFVLLFML